MFNAMPSPDMMRRLGIQGGPVMGGAPDMGMGQVPSMGSAMPEMGQGISIPNPSFMQPMPNNPNMGAPPMMPRITGGLPPSGPPNMGNSGMSAPPPMNGMVKRPMPSQAGGGMMNRMANMQKPAMNPGLKRKY